ncbi:meiosis-specific nuclear structural protein 1 [Holotrichia oblita]|uniref:Meiosis-specific nuclear structural protein 1 n=1 Tax=Holotrichia oblita TaxID=644536 RepID=A0ACB9T0B0_HOLOL|nr:meiosis-specific nuclear structural protein 1 [Holotrichia oblita]
MALNKLRKEKLAQEMNERKFYECIELERAKIDHRNKYRNLNRYMQLQRTQMEEDEHVSANEQAAIKVSQIEQEEKLAQEVDKMKREEIKELRMREEALKLEEELREKKIQEVLHEARLTQEEYLMKEAQEEIKRKSEYKLALQDQMILREKTKRYLYEEFLREKKMIDDIIQRIHEEDERLLEEKWCRMQKTREEMMAFKAAQEDGEERRGKYVKGEINDRFSSENIRGAGSIINIIVTLPYYKFLFLYRLLDEETREKDYVLQELKEREFQEEVERRHRADVEFQVRQRIELQEVLQKQIMEREERIRKEQKEEQLYKQQLLAKLIEDEKLEQMSEQRKRMKMLQLKRDVEDMMTQRRQRQAEEMQEKIRLDEEEKKEAVKRRQIIEEERLKILKEHAQNLIGHIPRGVLREEDLEHLGASVADVYRKKQ